MTLDTLIDKTDGFEDFSQKEKVKYMAYFFQALSDRNSFTPKEVSQLFVEANLAVPRNIHDVFGKLLQDKPRELIKIKDKYSLERHFIKKMDSIYENGQSAKIAKEMGSLVSKMKNEIQKEFLEDSIKCINAHVYRPAIIMMWLLTMDILYDFVLNNKLAEFNNELKKRNIKYTIAKKSDFEDIKESVFVEVSRSAAIISKEQKKILDDKLDIRNSAAHPNQTSFKEAKAVSFVEELMIDIVQKFQISR